MNVSIGDVITSVNRQRVTEEVSLEKALEGSADKEIFVGILRTSSPSKPLGAGENRKGGGGKGSKKKGGGKEAREASFFHRKSQANNKKKSKDANHEQGGKLGGKGPAVPLPPESAVLRVLALGHDDLCSARYRDWVNSTQW